MPERTRPGCTVALVGPEDYRALCPRLGVLLADAVRSGAGVNFVLPFDEADGEAYWRGLDEEVTAGRRLVLVAREGGGDGPQAVVGTVTLVPATMPNQAHRADVAKLLVHRDHRRRGVATLLMRAVAGLARSRDRTLLTLDCVADGPEEAFYRGIGFTVAGRVPGYARSPSGVLEGATFLYRHLDAPAPAG
jgi:ribosomal protein S18 acetylase RimI-like enzyme